MKNLTVHQSNFVDKTVVTIKAKAYYKMLVHILRFGSKARDHRQFKECMGILIGRLEGTSDIKNVIIEDAVPVSHGGSIEVAFKPEDYITFSYIDAEYAEQDPPLFSCGWYHSHPNLRIFFSSTDIKNQLGWQTPNPSAIGIVFDHTYLETPGDMGFRTFRLDDPAKGPMTDYHEVKTIVESPDSIEFYIKIMNLINSIHSKEPPILELNETPDLFGDISVPGQSQIMAKQPEIELTDLLTSLQTGISNLIELTFEPLIRFLNSWSQDMIKKVVENNLQMRTDLVNLKNNISQGMNDIQNTVKNSISNKLYDLDAYFDDRLEVFDKDIETVRTSVNQMKENLNTEITKLFEEKVSAAINPIFTLFEQNTKAITQIEEAGAKNTQSLEAQQKSLEGLSKKLKTIEGAVLEKINTGQDKIKEAILGKVGIVTTNLSDLNKQTKEFSSDLDTAISILETSKQDIKTKMEKAKSDAAEASAKAEAALKVAAASSAAKPEGGGA